MTKSMYPLFCEVGTVIVTYMIVSSQNLGVLRHTFRWKILQNQSSWWKSGANANIWLPPSVWARHAPVCSWSAHSFPERRRYTCRPTEYDQTHSCIDGTLWLFYLSTIYHRYLCTYSTLKLMMVVSFNVMCFLVSVKHPNPDVYLFVGQNGTPSNAHTRYVVIKVTSCKASKVLRSVRI